MDALSSLENWWLQIHQGELLLTPYLAVTWHAESFMWPAVFHMTHVMFIQISHHYCFRQNRRDMLP